MKLTTTKSMWIQNKQTSNNYTFNVLQIALIYIRVNGRVLFKSQSALLLHEFAWRLFTKDEHT